MVDSLRWCDGTLRASGDHLQRRATRSAADNRSRACPRRRTSLSCASEAECRRTDVRGGVDVAAADPSLSRCKRCLVTVGRLATPTRLTRISVLFHVEIEDGWGDRVRSIDVKDEPIRAYSDFPLDWRALIPPLPDGRFYIDSKLSMQGDAPKSFIRIREHLDGRDSGKNSRRRRITRSKNRWPGYIAKVGSKWYPVESITEQLLTRLGQLYGLSVADSHLRIVGNQVRFLSLYFLAPHESLFHGIDIFKSHLDSDLVEEIAETRQEQHFYTFQTVRAAVEERFPDYVNEITTVRL